MSKKPRTKSKSAAFPKTVYATFPDWGDKDPLFGTVLGLAMARGDGEEFEVAEYKLVKVTRAKVSVGLVE